MAVIPRSPSAATYGVVNARGQVVRQVQVGDSRGYSGGQYANAFSAAQKIANAASNRTGEAYSVQFASPFSGIPQTQHRAPGVASYTVKTANGAEVRRVLVGDIRGYDGGQYSRGYDVAKRLADAVSKQTGQPASVTFNSPWRSK